MTIKFVKSNNSKVKRYVLIPFISFCEKMLENIHKTAKLLLISYSIA